MIFGAICKIDQQARDLQFWVELRGFEPLTPSMRMKLPKFKPEELGRAI